LEFVFWPRHCEAEGRGKHIISDNERWYNKSMATQRKVKVTCLDEIKEIIEQHRPELKKQFHVEKIGVFGSYARGDQKKRSDVDFLVTFDKNISLMELGGLYSFLQDIMGRRVHVVPKDNIRPEFREGIIRDVLYI